MNLFEEHATARHFRKRHFLLQPSAMTLKVCDLGNSEKSAKALMFWG
jgi:hypothetical protein